MRKIISFVSLFAVGIFAQITPTINLPGFEVRTVVSGLSDPTTMAFLGADDFLVLEKNTGKIIRLQTGRENEVLDLAVNSASERGLLGIALHPQFATDRGVYLFWTCRTPAARSTTDRAPETCDTAQMMGEDTSEMLAVPLLGNRVDRFTWDGSKLTFDRNIISLRSLQADGVANPAGQTDLNQPDRGNHDGGVIAFGPDGKLYVFFGDQGRRGRLQNLTNGPPPQPGDDQFGGPEPDNAHLAGVILRLNPDGSTPADNPFFAEGARMGGEAGANVQKIFAYGMRNGFGIAFDPFSGSLWMTEHGDDTFDEINLVHPGMNGGWVQTMGPISRIGEYKNIETTFFATPETFPSLQQRRWAPSLIADNATEARNRMFMLPGAVYVDPQFSWRWATLPGTLGFAPPSFGTEVAGKLLVAVVGDPRAAVGYLAAFPVTPTRTSLEFSDPNLADRVADNTAKFDLTETQPLIVGEGFGIATDMQLSPRNTVYVVSHSNGAVYEVSAPGQTPADPDAAGIGPLIRATLAPQAGGDQDASGTVTLRLHSGRGLVCFNLNLVNLSVPATLGLIREGSGTATLADLASIGTMTSSGCVSATSDLINSLRATPGTHSISLRNAAFPDGAASGRLQ